MRYIQFSNIYKLVSEPLDKFAPAGVKEVTSVIYAVALFEIGVTARHVPCAIPSVLSLFLGKDATIIIQLHYSDGLPHMVVQRYQSFAVDEIHIIYIKE